MPLPQEVEASYVVIIDSILAASDLSSITSRRIRDGLQRSVQYDITPQKAEIKTLIMARFDKFCAEQNSSVVANGHSTPPKPESAKPLKAEADTEVDTTGILKTEESRTEVSKEPTIKVAQVEAPISPILALSAPVVSKPAEPTSNGNKRHSDDDDSLSDAPDSPPPKKRRKQKPALDDDAAFAAKLQAEENIRARPTRGGANRKAAVAKRKRTPKKKTKDKIRPEDDSDMEGSDESGKEKNVKRNGAFHKPLLLSQPLSALLNNETQLSRPQTVKRIWDYVKEHDLQDPSDKRQIRCDDKLRAVFKSDKVHMFTMNKILSQNLYNPEE